MSRYFSKYRTSVMILSSTGSTFGMALYSFLVPYLVEKFAWKGCLLILGGTALNLCACACVLFPLKEIITVKKKRIRFVNLSLMKCKYFTLYCIHCIFCNVSNSMVVLHLPSLVLSFGLSATVSSLSLTVYGICNCFGKCVFGIVDYLTHVNAGLVYTISLILSGILMALTPVVAAEAWVLTLVAFLSFAYNVTGGHSLAITLELAGQEHFADAVGISLLFKAAGTLLAGPLAGRKLKHHKLK